MEQWILPDFEDSAITMDMEWWNCNYNGEDNIKQDLQLTWIVTGCIQGRSMYFK